MSAATCSRRARPDERRGGGRSPGPVKEGDYPFLGFLLDLPVTVVVALDAAAAQRSGILAHAAHAADPVTGSEVQRHRIRR